ncbi:MAG: hypothetical protein HY645_14660 [Acidobacteria bacterium]|nr:hypothetical protein [Acidobacteriota bacterium]
MATIRPQNKTPVEIFSTCKKADPIRIPGFMSGGAHRGRLRSTVSGTLGPAHDLPGKSLNGAAGKLLGGWTISGIGRLSDGHPFQVSSGAQPSFVRFVQDYPDLKPGVTEVPVDSRNPELYFDPAAFTVPIVPGGYLIGNFGRNVLIAPGVANFDPVMANQIRAGEKVGIQFSVRSLLTLSTVPISVALPGVSLTPER